MQTISANQEHAISLLHRNFLNAATAKLSSFMVDNLHPEFIFTSPRAIVLNKEAFINDFVANPDIQLELFEMREEEKIVLIGTVAVLSGKVKAKFNGKEEFWVRITSTFANVGSNWQLLAMQETFIPQ